MSFIKLKEYCKNHSISYNTGYRWFKNKQITGAYKTDSGTILIPDTFNKSNSKFDKTDAIALLLDRSIEFTNNEASILDFTAYILSHFNFTFISDDSADSPRYSKMMPKSEVVQNHFKQFMKPKGLKPELHMFVPEDTMPDLFAQSDNLTTKDLVDEIKIITNTGNSIADTDLKELPEVKDLKHSEIVGGVVRSDNLTPQFNYTAPNTSPDDSFVSNNPDLEFPVNFKFTKKELEQQLPTKPKRTKKDKRNSQ